MERRKEDGGVLETPANGLENIYKLFISLWRCICSIFACEKFISRQQRSVTDTVVCLSGG